MNINQGFNLVGICKGIAPDGDYYNLGIAEETTDEFGQPNTNTHRVSINQTARDRLANEVERCKGKLVIVNVAVVMRRSPRTGNMYQSVFVHQNTTIQLLEAKAS